MQDLTTNVVGNYTQAQLNERLTADGAAVGCRFDILDPLFGVTASLGSVSAQLASVEYDTSRPIVGSLGLTMLPNEAINIPFKYRIRPWFRLGMRDGGIAEWPVGTFLWNVPTRFNIGRPDEYWEVTLGDLSQVMFLGGPGSSGFVAPKGAVVTEVITSIVAALGFDTSGIVPSPAPLTAALQWGVINTKASLNKIAKDYNARLKAWQIADRAWRTELARLRNFGLPGHHPAGMSLTGAQHAVNALKTHEPKRPPKPTYHMPYAGAPGTSWLDILTALGNCIGYYAPWFDLTGRYRHMPQPDLLPTAGFVAGAQPVKIYRDGSDGILVTPSQDQQDLTSMCNRVFAVGGSADGYYDLAIADLNVISPGHPFSQQQLGFYVDVTVQDQVSTTQAGLAQTAAAELNRRISTVRSYTVDSLAWPVHEAYDIIGLNLSTDPELAAGITTLETDWTFDLRAGAMTHTLQRITP